MLSAMPMRRHLLANKKVSVGNQRRRGSAEKSRNTQQTGSTSLSNCYPKRMLRQISYAAIFGLIIGVSTFAQGTIDKYGNFHPTEEQLAKIKRMGELFRDANIIT